MNSVKNSFLTVTMFLSGVGIVFSSYLSLGELSSGGSCALGTCSNIGGVPTCVFGLILFLLIFVFSGWGLLRKSEKDLYEGVKVSGGDDDEN